MSFVVGLTGGIGCGKTVASDHFALLGTPVIDTDVIAREIVTPDAPALKMLVAKFGDKILLDDNSLDRAALRKLAFSSKKNKDALDAITHPAIQDETFKQIQNTSYPYCIVVIPLLSTDSVFTEFIDRVLCVTATHETKVTRVMQRSQLSREEVLRIMATQLTDEERLNFSDDVIENNGSIADAHAKVKKLHSVYLDLSATS